MEQVQIRPTPHPIRFDRVDHPLEAMAAPSADALAGLVTGQMLNRTPIVDVHNTIQAPDGTRTEMTYRMEKTPTGLRISGQAGGERIEESVSSDMLGLQVQGRLGASSDQMRIDTTVGGFAYHGQVGDIPVRQRLAMNPFAMGFQLTGQFGPALLHMTGQANAQGTATTLQGDLDGKPLTGSIQGGPTPESILVTREVDGYHWIQEIRTPKPTRLDTL